MVSRRHDEEVFQHSHMEPCDEFSEEERSAVMEERCDDGTAEHPGELTKEHRCVLEGCRGSCATRLHVTSRGRTRSPSRPRTRWYTSRP